MKYFFTKQLILPMILVVFLLGAGCTLQKSNVNVTNANQGATSDQLPATSDVLGVILGNSNGTDTTTAQLQLKNGTTVAFGTVPVLLSGNEHWIDYRNGHLYGVRFTGTSSAGFLQDFIRVDQNGTVTSLFQGSAARGWVSPDEHYAVANDNIDPVNVVFINLLDMSKKEVLLAGAGQPAVPHIVFQGWSSDNAYAWARTEAYANPQEFYRITPAGSVTRYRVSSEITLGASFNPDTAQLVYDTFPEVPAMEVEGVEKSGVTVQLYLYNVATSEKKLVATSHGKQFNAKWESPGSFSYNDPVTSARTTAKP